MVNFEDDFFAPMVQDESRKKLSSGGTTGSSSRSGPKSSSSSSRVKPPSSSSKSSSGSSSNNNSSNARPSKSSSTRDSRGSGGDSHQHRPTSSRRTGGGSREQGTSRSDSGGNEPDYDYGDAPPPSQDQGLDYGYDDTEQSAAAQPSARSRRQRRCSIADVLNVPGGEADDEVAAPASTTAAAAAGASNISSLSRAKSMERNQNIAIPMAADEPARKGRARRASLMGAMGAMGFGGDDKKEAESKDQSKKPGQDRDRRRQGTLMDRVGAGDRERSSRAGGMSYSDRILSK
jgi:hypothetical protein